jgi:glutamate-ammonia-ligase adenylyltransferase
LRLPLSPYASLPPPGDADQRRLGIARWLEAAQEIEDPFLAAFMRDLVADDAGNRLLSSLFGNSPFLTQCCLTEPDLLMRLLQQGPETTLADVEDGLNRLLPAEIGRPALMRALRLARRRMALLVAVADLARWWPLERVTGALSRFADQALAVAVRHLLAAAARRGEIALAHPAEPERDSGFIVLGMGKLGAGELNYSSDIDLVLLYDPDKARYAGRHSVATFFAGLARELVALMQERTADGYVFRTDLRLRPDAGATPPALSVGAALLYYESAGQNWERAALIKARPVAGDLAAGQAFLAQLRPFLWRKHLDFAAIEDIHSIKRQINAHRGGARIAVAGHNVKLGRGGIREIEFFAQTQQLIWGGRLPALRAPATCAALDALASAGRIAAGVAAELIAAYRFLRQVEHRLQMVDDAQTHTLPADAAGLERLAAFMDYASGDDLRAALLRHLATVESRYAALFEEAPSLAAPGNLVFTGTEDDPETLKTLAGLGFADPPAVAARIRAWHHGRYRSTRSQRARELLTEVVPALLRAFGASANPDAALLRFDQFLAHLPAGVQLFSLLQRNAALLGLLAEIMAAGPRLAELLARRPALLDAVLSGGFFDPPPEPAALAAELEEQLAGARDYQDLLDAARRWVADRKFQVGVQLLRARLDGEAAGTAFADIAEAAIGGLLPRVADHFARAHGRVEGGSLIVLGLGKLGGREMTMTSDLDLILVYDAPEGVEMSDGERPLAVSTYYARLSHRLIDALTAMTPEGNLYEVDMRLRPSGSKGPVASSLDAFRRYHRELAWTWEQLALTRARPVTKPDGVAAAAMMVVTAALAQRRDRRSLARDVADMRNRMAESRRNPGFWDVKHRRGGLVDIEFIAQYLQLREAAQHPEILRQNTAAALAALAEAGFLGTGAATELLAALKLWHDVQGLIKLTVAEPFDEATATPALKALLARGAGAVDFAALKADMEAAATRALGHYRAIIEAEAHPEEQTP